jgi:hypothetical protein
MWFLVASLEWKGLDIRLGLRLDYASLCAALTLFSYYILLVQLKEGSTVLVDDLR